MVEIAENFSYHWGLMSFQILLGQIPFVKPQDRDVVCHASAWNLDSNEDLRIKMCIEKMQKTSQRFTMN